MTEKPKPTVISFLLDETGSMNSIRDDTIGGFNTYVGDLKAGDSADRISFSLVKFDSNRIEKVHVGVPISDVPDLTHDTYRPGASTPLIDAAYKTITATREHVKARDDAPNVVVVIQTDGHENCSTEHTHAELAALIKELTADGWQFVFLSAGIDAFAQASAWGISAQNTASYDRGNSGAAFSAVSRATGMYASTGDAGALSFTQAERASMGGTQPQASQGGDHLAGLGAWQGSTSATNGGPKTHPMTRPATRAQRRQPKVVDDFAL